jgi:hypothetical protein
MPDTRVFGRGAAIEHLFGAEETGAAMASEVAIPAQVSASPAIEELPGLVIGLLPSNPLGSCRTSTDWSAS